jgi:hypothetical protein
MQGVTALAGQVAGMAPLFDKTASVRQLGKLTTDVEKAGLSQKDFQQQLEMLGAQNPTFGNLAGVGAMNPTQFQAFMGGLSPEYLKSLRSAYSPTNIFLQQPGAAVTAADLSMGLPQ